MKTLEFLENEFIQILNSEIKTVFNNDNLIKEQVNSIMNDDFSDDIISKFKDDKKLSSLKYSISVLEDILIVVAKFNQIPENIIKRIEERYKKNTKNKIYGLLWVMTKQYTFENDEYFNKEIEVFYALLFKNFDYLIKLNDFISISQSNILNIIVDEEFWGSDNMCSIIENAMSKYPKNIYIIERLANIYTTRNEFQKAIDTIDLFEGVLSENHKSFNYSDDEYTKQKLHLDILQLKSNVYYQLKMYKEALTEVNRVINNLPNHPFIDERTEKEKADMPMKDVDEYIESLLIRISINIKENADRDLIIADCKTLKSDWVIIDIDSWKEDYPKAIHFIKHHKK